MRRSAPLRRTTALRTRSPLRRVALTARRRATGPSLRTVERVLERAGYSCEVCARMVGHIRGVDWSIHHRRPRGMGGTNNRATNFPSNLLLVCGSGTSGCHGAIEGYRVGALIAGWLLLAVQDPATAPVLIGHGTRWVLLATDGTYSPVREG